MTNFIRTTAILLTLLALSGCGAKKVHTVKMEAEANQIVDVLRENGFKAVKEENGEGEKKVFEIRISGDDDTVALAIQVMQDHCLGQPEPPMVESSSPLITSINTEQAREQRRLKMNIESQLRSLPGATCVSVNFVPPQDRSLAINPYPASASVLINYKTPTFPVTKDEVKGLVARSVPDLNPEKIEVVLTSKPPRPVSENQLAYNITRIAMVAGIGLATILGFVSIVFYLQRKRRRTTDDFNKGKDEPTVMLPESNED